MTSRTNLFRSILRIGCISALVMAASCEDSLIRPVGNLVSSKQFPQRTTPDVLVDHVRTFYGPAVPIGQGVARTWASVNAAGEPVSLGVNISEHAVRHLPQEHQEYVLQFPVMAQTMPYDHITLGWNPRGHFPPGIYDVPHLDVHFNMIDEATREAIPGMFPPYMDPAPAAQYIPAGYVQTPGVEPAMGAHWIDVFSAEFQPQGVFTNTLILGTFDSQVIFWEPMVTVDYLMTKPHDVRPVSQPLAYQATGYYPLTYSVEYRESPGTFSISLDNLVHRVGQ